MICKTCEIPTLFSNASMFFFFQSSLMAGVATKMISCVIRNAFWSKVLASLDATGALTSSPYLPVCPSQAAMSVGYQGLTPHPSPENCPRLKGASLPRDAQNVMLPQGGRWPAANEWLMRVLKVLDSCLRRGQSCRAIHTPAPQAEARLHGAFIFSWLLPLHCPASLIPTRFHLRALCPQKSPASETPSQGLLLGNLI